MVKSKNGLIYTILSYKIITSLLIGIFMLILLIIVFTLIDFNDTKISLEPILSMFSLLVTLIAALIALLIPFIMKDIELRKKKESEQKSIKIIIERIKEYLNLPVRSEDESKFPSSHMPYFMALAANQPHLLIKLGIEVQTREDPQSGLKYTDLYILDKYRLFIGSEDLVLEKVNFYGLYENIYTIPGITDTIITEIKENATEKFGFIFDN